MLVAAGQGTRLGANKPKALVAYHGKTILEHALAGVLQMQGISEVVVVFPPGYKSDFDTLIAALSEANGAIKITLVEGGASRQSSVYRGLRAIKNGGQNPVLIHDAARCGTPPQVFDRIQRAVTEGAEAVVPTLKIADSLRNVAGGVVDREQLRAVQTPQGFTYQTILEAHQNFANIGESEQTAASDDATLVERDGGNVTLVDGHPHAQKITTPHDLALLQYLLEQPV